MTRDDILRMAKEAGAFFDGDCSVYDMPEHCFEKFAALVAAAEREECAKVVDRYSENSGWSISDDELLAEISGSIRARR